ncbi:MAG: P-II family nitrogen regulator [Pseudomonadota bacterium]
MAQQFSKVVAIMDILDFKSIQSEMKKLDLPGVSVSTVQGFGDYHNAYSDCGFSEGMKIEIYTTYEHAQSIAQVLSQLANDMTEGGGMVAIEPVSELYNVKKLNT